MTDEIRDKLLRTARDRLRNRPGAYRQFQAAIDSVAGQGMLLMAEMPFFINKPSILGTHKR